MVSMPAYHAVVRGSIPVRTRRVIIRCKKLALNIRDRPILVTSAAMRWSRYLVASLQKDRFR